MPTAWLYIMTNRPNGTLYIGATSNLARRVWEHQERVAASFTERYGLDRLVYAEHHEHIISALHREKTLKTWRRAWKVRLIGRVNPNWNDLFERL